MDEQTVPCVAWCVQQMEYPISRTYHYEIGPTVERVFTLINRWYRENNRKNTLNSGEMYVITMEVLIRLGGRILFGEEE